MEIPKIFGIGGGMREGKDTTYHILKNLLLEIGVESVRYALADPLKLCVNSMFDWNEDHSDGELKEVVAWYSTSLDKIQESLDLHIKPHTTKSVVACDLVSVLISNGILIVDDPIIRETSSILEVYISPRKMYQLFGTEYIKVMISEDFWYMLAEMAYDSLGDKRMIIPDIRFPEEVDWLRGFESSKLIGVTREGVKRTNNHISEKHLAYVLQNSDALVINPNSVHWHDEMVEQVRNILSE